MKLSFLQEPELKFGDGSHLDIKFGLMNFGPLDKGTTMAPKEIRVGLIGTNETIQALVEWFKRCEEGIPAKISTKPKPNLFPKFPGFGFDKPLPAKLVYDKGAFRILPMSVINQIIKYGVTDKVVEEAVNTLVSEARYLAENKNIDVIVFAPPVELLKMLKAEDYRNQKFDFRNLLKAKVMQLKKPCQVILPTTYNLSSPSTLKNFKSNLQDEATIAWNFYTALYYKAGGVPWRIKQSPSDFTTCYIGIGFYESLDKSTIQTSIAQVFNERGEGIILRGGQAQISKEDRKPYLEETGAYSLLIEALGKYKEEHQTLPARVVIHKTSEFRGEELNGFTKAVQEKGISLVDFVSIYEPKTRLLRIAAYPPLRGTFLNIDDKYNILYTRGSINFYQTYPGLYIPAPLGFRCDRVEQSPQQIAEEILVLTKMNWNNTSFDNSDPITIVAARRVGAILKYIDEHENVESRYSYYI